MKTLKIETPEGYEIDKEKSTFENIVFKPKTKEFPKTWEELGEVEGWYVSSLCYAEHFDKIRVRNSVKNTFVTEEQAVASIALAQLSQLREVYRNGWFPDWAYDPSNKYCIVPHFGKIEIVVHQWRSYFLSFQSEEVANDFLINFRDLIEQAIPLMK